MRPRLSLLGPLLLPFLCGLAACGADGGGAPDLSSGDKDGGVVPETPPEKPPAPNLGNLSGVWEIEGTDARGPYTGFAEIRTVSDELRYYRSVKYTGVVVEGDRDLHWALTGKARGDVNAYLDADVELDNRAFVRKRGALERKITDPTVTLACAIYFKQGSPTSTCKGGPFDLKDTWKNRTAAGAQPLVVVDRTIRNSEDAPSSATRNFYFNTYASYHALPEVYAFSADAAFQAAVHGHWIDKGDFDFYRANKNAVRVVNKAIDDISTQEALIRANAYRSTLGEKAAGFDAELETDFVHPATGMVLDGAPEGQAKEPHYSAALWTGVYFASQIYRWQVTGEANALANAEKTLDGILKLQEVTDGDWTQFARAIRPTKNDPTGGWHTGTGAFSAYEWLEGGNNDMMKGLYIAYALGYEALCGAGGTHAALCGRIRVNAKHLADDASANIDRGNAALDSAWLTAYVSTDTVEKAKYTADAVAEWTKPTGKAAVLANVNLYNYGLGADWSGLHLGFVGHLFHQVLASSLDLNGDAKATYRQALQSTWDNGLSRHRLPLWGLLQQAYGTSPQAVEPKDDTLWRMREMPFPKPIVDVDHRVSPTFVLSPYPSLPWKNDWTTTDRTQALRTVPLFEEALDINRFRLELKFRGEQTTRMPGFEYLVAYWFGRKANVLGAAD